MTVGELFDYVKYGEFAQIGISTNLDSVDVAVQTRAEKQVLSYMNLALIELYKRFDLRTEETVVTLADNQTMYTIDPVNIYNDPNNLTGYLSALPGEFNHIISAYDEEGSEYGINEENDALSILTPNWNTIQVPNPIAGEAVFLIYNSAPDPITWETDSATTLAKIVPIPPVLLEALMNYMGYRGHGSMNGSINAENNTHLQRFEASCARVETLGVLAQDGIKIGRSLEEKGFV